MKKNISLSEKKITISKSHWILLELINLVTDDGIDSYGF